MADHHEAFNNMLQMNGLGLVHHLNGGQPQPQVDMNGAAASQQAADPHRNGNTTPSQQHTQNSSSGM